MSELDPPPRAFDEQEVLSYLRQLFRRVGGHDDAFERINNDLAGSISEVQSQIEALSGQIAGLSANTGADREFDAGDLDMDIGWAANGTDAADPDGFGNLGVWTGDAVTDVKPETQIWYPFNGVLKDGPKTFAAETTIQLEANAAAATGGTGTVYVGVYYLVP